MLIPLLLFLVSMVIIATITNPSLEDMQDALTRERDLSEIFVTRNNMIVSKRETEYRLSPKEELFMQQSTQQQSPITPWHSIIPSHAQNVEQLMASEELEHIVHAIKDTISPQLYSRIITIYDVADGLTAGNVDRGSENNAEDVTDIRKIVYDDLAHILRIFHLFSLQDIDADSLALQEEKLQQKVLRIETFLSDKALSLYNHALYQSRQRLHAMETHSKENIDDVAHHAIHNLSHIEQQAEQQLPQALASKIYRISALVQILLPELVDDDSISGRDAFNVRQTAFDYLPTMMQHYAALPSDLAMSHVLNNGQTAYENFSEQLDILHKTLQKIANSAYHHDANGLLVHGRFLAEKFSEADEFQLEPLP